MLPHLFLGGGPLGELLRQHPWETSAFGLPGTWCSPLRASLSLCLNTSTPSCIYWGPGLHMLYNDSWSVIPGKRHPGSLGKPAHEVWETEAWGQIGQLIKEVLASGKSASFENHLVPIERAGSSQECYFTHTGSAIRADDGSVLGVFNGSIESTQAVVAQRRACILGNLAEALFQTYDGRLGPESALQTLGSAAYDLPFLGFFERDRHDSSDISLRAVAGAALPGLPSEGFLPSSVAVAGDGRVLLPFASDASPSVPPLPAGWQIFMLDGSSAPVPHSIWGRPVERMLLLPLRARAASSAPQAWLLCGLSPLAPMDAQYQAFFGSLASLLGASISGRPGGELNGYPADLTASAVQASGFGAWSYGPRSHNPAQAELSLSNRARQLLASLVGVAPDTLTAEAQPATAPADASAQQRFSAALREALQREEMLSLVVPVSTAPDENRWLLMQASVQQDADGQQRLVGVVGDITQYQRQQENVCEKEKLAVVRRLSETMAHEMNNPLESLTNLLYLTSLDESLSPSTLQMMRLAEGELARVNLIAQQTLGFRRSSAGPVRTDLRMLVAELVLLLERRAESRGLRADISRVPSVFVHCLPGELRQILSNLLTNAFAASPRGGRILIAARLSRHHRTDEEVLRIMVADSGTGIAVADQKKVFKAFFTTHQDRGNGLGLWVAKTLLQQQNGTIRFRSRDRKPCGTCFMITLPTQPRRSFVQ